MGGQEPFSHRKVWITFFDFITIIIIIIISIIVIIINNYRLFNLSVYGPECLWYNCCGFACIIIRHPSNCCTEQTQRKIMEQI